MDNYLFRYKIRLKDNKILKVTKKKINESAKISYINNYHGGDGNYVVGIISNEEDIDNILDSFINGIDMHFLFSGNKIDVYPKIQKYIDKYNYEHGLG